MDETEAGVAGDPPAVAPPGEVDSATVPPWEEILEKVSEVIAEVMDLPRAEVRPESRFFTDLGGESIDFVELSYTLEKSFDLRILMEELFSQDFFQYRAEDIDRELRPEEMAEIRRLLPFLELPEGKPIVARDLPTLYTVETFARFVQWRLEVKASEPKPVEEKRVEGPEVDAAPSVTATAATASEETPSE